MKDLVSVIMPFYNEEKYLNNSIKSVLIQTYKNIELLLINDNSTDASMDVCTSFKDSRIKIINKKDQKKGAASSRNLAIDQANGNFITIQDADDIVHPERIEKQLRKANENPNKLIVGTWVIKVDKKEIKLRFPIENQDIIKGFKRKFNRVTFTAGTLFCSCEILRKYRYREKINYLEDWDLLLRLYEAGVYEFYNIPEYLYIYYIRDKGTKAKPDWIDYNYFTRDCQQRRLKGEAEYENIEAFRNFISKNKIENVKWSIFKYLDKAKLRIFG